MLGLLLAHGRLLSLRLRQNSGYGFKKELGKASNTSGAPRNEEMQVLVLSDSARCDSGSPGPRESPRMDMDMWGWGTTGYRDRYHDRKRLLPRCGGHWAAVAVQSFMDTWVASSVSCVNL